MKLIGKMKLFLIFVIVICYILNGVSADTVSVLNSVLQLEDLNDDVLLEIFDKSEFEDLMSIAETSYRFRALIVQHLIYSKYRFHEKIVQIFYVDMYGDIEFDHVSIDITAQALRVLRNFGYLIPHILVILDPSKSPQSITTMINKYCSESLDELKVQNFYADIFLDWRKQFKNVTKVHFDSGYWDCGTNNRNLSEIFPSMRRFDMSMISLSSSKCIDYHFPNLEHIKFSVHINDFSGEKTYENIFDLNPQLRSIHVTHLHNFDVLRVANEKLNNLEAIELSNFLPNCNNNETIYFRDVKRFHIKLNEIEPLSILLKFHELEEIQFNGRNYPIAQKWIEFVGKQPKLKTLIIDSRLNLERLHLLTLIIEKLSELEVIKIYWNWNYGCNEIAKMMTTNTKLQKVVIFDMTTEMCTELRRITDSQWQYEEIVRRSRFVSTREATFIPRKNYF